MRQGAAEWKLAGIIFAVTPPIFQPPNTVLFGNLTFNADLAQYRDQIVDVVFPPACRDGIDNDGNGLRDFPADPGCSSRDDAVEASGMLVLSPETDRPRRGSGRLARARR